MSDLEDQRAARTRLRQPSNDFNDVTAGWSEHSATVLAEYEAARATAVDASALTKDDLSSVADAKGVDVPASSTKPEIIAAVDLHHEDLDQLSRAQLFKIAANQGLDLPSTARKDEIIAAIQGDE